MCISCCRLCSVNVNEVRNSKTDFLSKTRCAINIIAFVLGLLIIAGGLAAAVFLDLGFTNTILMTVGAAVIGSLIATVSCSCLMARPVVSAIRKSLLGERGPIPIDSPVTSRRRVVQQHDEVEAGEEAEEREGLLEGGGIDNPLA